MTIKQQGGIFGRNPTFNDVTVDGKIDRNVSSGDIVNFASNGTTVGSIGARSGVSSYLVLDPRSAFNGSGLVGVGSTIRPTNYSGTAQDALVSLGDASNGFLNMTLKGNLIIGTSGKGIDFSATSGTGTSELFDDYEEGTWTPTYAPSTGSFTSITYGNTGGVYTKIGNICIVSGYISTSALDTTGGSGAIKVGGLPYGIAGSSGGTRDAWRGGSIGYSAGWSGERPSSVFASGGASDFRIMYRSNATSDSSYVLVADMDTSGANEIAFTLTYRV